MMQNPPIIHTADEMTLRSALARFATGVTVVTARNASGDPVGLTVSSFSSVSLHPPLILWCLARSSSLFEVFHTAPHFAVNVLRADQLALGLQFAQRGIDRFAQVPLREGHTSAPMLKDALAWFECDNRNQHTEGDHVILVGEVLHSAYTYGAPLIHHSRDYHVSQPHPEIIKNNVK